MGVGSKPIPLARIPWASLALALVCLAGPLWVNEAPPGSAAGEAAQFWRAHPYLRAAPEIVAAATQDTPSEIASPPDDPRLRAAQQDELARMTLFAFEQGLAASDSAWRRWGVVPGAVTPLRLLTHALVSPGWTSAASHLIALALVAVALEARLGAVLLAALALGSLLAGASLHVLLSASGSAPLVGSAAAIAGLLGAFAVCMGRERVAWFGSSAQVDGRVLLAGAVVFELLASWLVAAGGAAATARPHWAQIGGAVFGATSLLGPRLPEAARRLRKEVGERSFAPAASMPSLAGGLAARDRGDFAGALRILERARLRDPRDPDLALSVWETAIMARQAARGAPALAALVAHRVAVGEESVALEHWLDLRERMPGEPVEPAALLRLVPRLQERGLQQQAVAALRACVDSARGALPAGLALRVADLAREIDPASARGAALRALEFADLHEAKRERMHALLAELDEAPGPLRAPPPEPRDELDAFDPLDDRPRFAGLKLVDAAPVTFDLEVLRLRLSGERKARVAYAHVDAVAVAAVRGLAPRPVLLVDLLLNWSSFDEELLRVIRLRSNAFDPRSLFPGSTNALEALRSLVDEILQRTGALVLPDLQAAYGRPFRVFDDLAHYQREVLQVEG